MTETLSTRIDSEIKKRLDALSKRSRRSKSFLAAEAIAAYVDSEEWQLGELQAGVAELDSGQEISHEKVSRWLNSWGKPRQKPRGECGLVPQGATALSRTQPLSPSASSRQ